MECESTGTKKLRTIVISGIENARVALQINHTEDIEALAQQLSCEPKEIKDSNQEPNETQTNGEA